jgi:hypothetical protein
LPPAAATNRFASPQTRRIEVRQHVQTEVTNIPNIQAIRDLRIEADALEATYGPNAYSKYLREHNRRPDPNAAASIGWVLGGRVRADDGSMQPPLSAADRAALKDVNSRRKAFRLRFERIARLRAAIASLASLAENDSNPGILFGDEICLLNTPEVVAELDTAVYWLNRFAEYWHGGKTAASAPDHKRFCGD